jgi:hypothetical protein
MVQETVFLGRSLTSGSFPDAHTSHHIEVGTQLRGGPQNHTKQGPIGVNWDEVAAGVRDDAAAIAVSQRKAGMGISIPNDKKGVALRLLVDFLVVGRRSRGHGTGRLEHRGTSVVRVGKKVGRRLAEMPEIERIIQGHGRRQLPGGAIVGVDIDAACAGRTHSRLLGIDFCGSDPAHVIRPVGAQEAELAMSRRRKPCDWETWNGRPMPSKR